MYCFNVTDDINKILDEEPEDIDVLELLADHDFEWRELGQALNCKPGFLAGEAQKLHSNTIKLGEVITNWKETLCSEPVTWRTLLESVESKKFGEKKKLANEIRAKLSEDKLFKKYLEKKLGK